MKGMYSHQGSKCEVDVGDKVAIQFAIGHWIYCQKYWSAVMDFIIRLIGENPQLSSQTSINIVQKEDSIPVILLKCFTVLYSKNADYIELRNNDYGNSLY